jgi:mono/diheme cytochrome c family protein
MRILSMILTVLPLSIPILAKAETPRERGAYLVNSIAACGNCHSPQGPDGGIVGQPFSGGMRITDGNFFAIYAPNITSDRETGIGNWSEDQIITALRSGHTPDNKLLRPPMPIAFYRGISDTDIHSIAAYLQTLAPTHNHVPESSYSVVLPTTYGPLVQTVPDPDPADLIAEGSYLVQMGHCMACHSPLDVNGRLDLAHRLGAGGHEINGVVSANITSDKETGLGSWTDAQIRTALLKGKKPDGTLIASIMPWRYYAMLRPADIDSIVAYLHTVPPIHNKID